MKRLIVLLLIISGCSPTYLYRTNDAGFTEHQCFTPIPIFISENVPVEERLSIIQGIAFWNSYKPKLFFLFGITEYAPDDPRAISVTIGYPDNYSTSGNTLALTHIESYAKGCIISSNILLIEHLSSYNFETAKLIVVHELGHTLGLDDREKLGSIMRGAINIKTDNQPDELYPEEIEALNRLY